MDRPYHHGNLRNALLEAARARLAEAAEAELSLRDLAARVGVSVNATYRHFESKEALLMELAAQGFDALRGRMLAAIDGCAESSAAAHLRAAAEAYVAFAQEDPALFRLMFGRGGRFTGQTRYVDAAASAFGVVKACVATIRGAAQDAPEVGKAAIAAWSLVHGYAALRLGGYLQGVPEARRPSVREVFGLLALDADRSPP
jgi:AcrR family transcriptional regulator